MKKVIRNAEMGKPSSPVSVNLDGKERNVKRVRNRRFFSLPTVENRAGSLLNISFHIKQALLMQAIS